MMNSVMVCNLRCASYCELYTLNMVDFYRLVVTGFRSKSSIVKEHIKSRIKNAEEMHQIAENQIEMRQKSTGNYYYNHFWLKIFH